MNAISARRGPLVLVTVFCILFVYCLEPPFTAAAGLDHKPAKLSTLPATWLRTSEPRLKRRGSSPPSSTSTSSINIYTFGPSDPNRDARHPFRSDTTVDSEGKDEGPITLPRLRSTLATAGSSRVVEGLKGPSGGTGATQGAERRKQAKQAQQAQQRPQSRDTDYKEDPDSPATAFSHTMFFGGTDDGQSLPGSPRSRTGLSGQPGSQQPLYSGGGSGGGAGGSTRGRRRVAVKGDSVLGILDSQQRLPHAGPLPLVEESPQRPPTGREARPSPPHRYMHTPGRHDSDNGVPPVRPVDEERRRMGRPYLRGEEDEEHHRAHQHEPGVR